jgi:hypothetical protein
MKNRHIKNIRENLFLVSSPNSYNVYVCMYIVSLFFFQKKDGQFLGCLVKLLYKNNKGNQYTCYLLTLLLSYDQINMDTNLIIYRYTLFSFSMLYMKMS